MYEEDYRATHGAEWWGILGLLKTVSSQEQGEGTVTHDGGRKNSSTSSSAMFEHPTFDTCRN